MLFSIKNCFKNKHFGMQTQIAKYYKLPLTFSSNSIILCSMRKPYDKRLNVWLDAKTKEQIKEIAEEEGRTISEIVRELFVKYIEKKKRKK
jgi:cytidylate kinase